MLATVPLEPGQPPQHLFEAGALRRLPSFVSPLYIPPPRGPSAGFGSICREAWVKIVRFILAVSLAALAAAPLLAAKPIAEDGSDPERETWRGQGISACAAELRRVPGLTPDDLESICGCAFDRFMPGRRTAALPPVAPGRLRGLMEAEIELCTAQIRPGQLAAVAGRAETPAMLQPTPLPPPPPEDEAPDKPEPADADFDFWAWLGNIHLPRWLTDLPWWALILIAPFVLALLAALFRRRDDRDDLLGPPPHMRPGASPVPPTPWRSRFPPPR